MATIIIPITQMVENHVSSIEFLKIVEEKIKEEIPAEVESKLEINIKLNVKGSTENRDFIFESIAQLRQDCNELKGSMLTEIYDKRKVPITIDLIKTTVCNYLGVPIELLKTKTRVREIVEARQIAMYFSKNLTKSSLATIGSQIGDKDHATVLHACKTVNNLMETNKIYRKRINEIKLKFRNN